MGSQIAIIGMETNRYKRFLLNQVKSLDEI